MTSFTYEAVTREGQRVSGTLAAGSDAEVRAELRRRGLYLVTLGGEGAAGTPPAAARRGWRLRPAHGVTLELTRELASLLEARFSLDRSLALLAEAVEDAEAAALVADVRGRVREGVPLSEALAAHPRFFPDYYVRMVAAGEEAGTLDTVVARLAAYLEERAELRSRLVSSLVYPAVMAVAGGVAVLVLLFGVLPQFVGVVEDAGRALPASTAALVFVSRALSRWWWLGLLLLALAGWGVLAWRRTPSGRRRLDRLDLALPVWGRLRRYALVARFCRMLATLLGGGVRFLTAVRVAGATVGGNVVAAEVLGRIEEQVRRGRPLAEVLGDGTLFPPLAAQMVRVGEESGELGRALEKVADIYERRIREETARLVTLVEPALIVLFGLAVAAVAAAMFQAIFSINEVPL